jgi:DNA-binding SARP family transcriptional activator
MVFPQSGESHLVEKDVRFAAPGPVIEVRLLGRVEVWVAGRELRLAGRQPQALLALLALRPRPRLRDAIAADLWPEAESPPSGALRQALWLVRSALSGAGIDPSTVLEIDQDAIGLRADSSIDLDAGRFEAALLDRPPRPEDALAEYRGDLCEGLGHECFARERERLSDAYEDALALVAERHLRNRDHDAARSVASRLLARDPLREEAHAVLIHIFGAIGSRSQVHRQYRRLCEVLEQDLGVDPLPETEAAYRAALAATVQRSSVRITTGAFRRAGGAAILSPT